MSEVAEDPSKSLSKMFQEGLDLFNNLGKIDEPTNSLDVQLNVRKSMKLLEESTRLVSYANIFSTNETIEEIPTEHIQYFLLPALLGSLTLKITPGDRKEIVSTAEIYFKDFLTRCDQYGLCDYKSDESSERKIVEPRSEFEEIEQQINTRATKIQRFQEQKLLKEKLVQLERVAKDEHADEENKRNYFLTMVKSYIHEVIDELRTLDVEKLILEHMSLMVGVEKPKPKRSAPLKPIIITKDEVQKAVFGAGYPSLPTMTVKEFYDKRVADGIFPDPTKPKTGGLSMQEAALAGISLNDDEEEARVMEELDEKDDDENIERLRAKDEYKDEHRRGWGNRMNRS